jgi:aminopeptidase N
MQNRNYSFVNSLPHLMSYRVLMAMLILVVISASSTAIRRERLIDSWKPLNYNVSLSLDDQLTTITSAKTEITILSLKDRLSQVDLDFGELTVDSVTVNGETAPFERSTGQLNVTLVKAAARNTRVLIVVSYHGKPTDGLILTADKAGRPSAIGDNWPNRVHHWIPSLDHPSAKATVRFTVTAPAREIVVGNGRLDRVSSATKATRTWTWIEAEPIPPYCMIIAVGEFAKVDSSTRSVTPLSYYVPVPDKKFAMQGFAPANPSLKFFSRTVAPYPYEKLALIVGATRFGGMENSSAIVFASSLFDPRPDSGSSSNVFKVREGIVEVVAHEIAHQWFGDSVTESTWADLWLSEGFATYFAGLFVQRYEGEQAFRQYMSKAAQSYFRYEKMNRTPIHDTETEDLFKLLNANNYQKGAWVLHMLRMELGDDAFFRGIRSYYRVHQGATANSEDLRAALERASGKTLKEFFVRWVYGTGHPQYELLWQWNSKTKKLRLVLNQIQHEPAFPNLLLVEILTTRGPRRVILKPAAKETIQDLELGEAPSAVNIDPENSVLKEATVNRNQSATGANLPGDITAFRNALYIRLNRRNQR